MSFDLKRYQVLETPFWVVNLATDDQAYLGRCYVTLKRSCGDMADLTSDEWNNFLQVVKKLERATKKAFGATMHNWTCLMNNAYQVEPAKPQVHWHFRPRYKNSPKIGDQPFPDPNFGHHYLRETEAGKPVDEEMSMVIIDAVKQDL